VGDEEIRTGVCIGGSIVDQRRAGRHRRALTRTALALGAVGALVALSAGPAAAEVRAGVAEIATPDGSAPLTGGASGALYSVVLPPGAACPGDTAHKGYLVYSYLLPKGDPLTSVSFKTGLPSEGLGYIASGAYFGAVNTAEWTGAITTIPDDFTWTRWTAGQLLGPHGSRATWEGGIACANVHGQVTRYWNTEIVFRADPRDPEGYRWSVDHDRADAPSGRSPWFVVAGVIGAVLIAVGVAGSIARRVEEDRRARS